MLTIEIEGAEKVQRRFELALQLTPAQLRLGMGLAVDAVAIDAASYPPESKANQPPPPFYIRGVGTQYANGENRGESEQLGSNWTREVKQDAEGVEGRIDNNVSYVPYVHGRVGQVWFHQRRRWRKSSGIARANANRVKGIFENVAKFLSNVLGGA